MNQSAKSLPERSILVYGATGLVGKAVCAEAIRLKWQVIGLCRNKCHGTSSSIEVNFTDYERLLDITAELLTGEVLPTSLIFCHRARINTDICKASTLLKMAAIEINPYLAVKEALEGTTKKGVVNIVTVTSNAGFKIAKDVDYSYQIIKSAQVAAAIGLSQISSTVKVYSNVVSFGEAVDNSKSEHDAYHKRIFNMLNQFTSRRPMATISNIAKMALVLANADTLGVCGQTITVDSGLNCQSNESMARILSRLPRDH